MRKIVVLQVVIAAILLIAFFIAFNITSDVEKAVFIAAVVVFGVLFYDIKFLNIATNTFSAILAAGLISILTGITVLGQSTTFIIIGIVIMTATIIGISLLLFKQLGINRGKAILSYLTQYFVTLAPMLYFTR